MGNGIDFKFFAMQLVSAINECAINPVIPTYEIRNSEDDMGFAVISIYRGGVIVQDGEPMHNLICELLPTYRQVMKDAWEDANADNKE